MFYTTGYLGLRVINDRLKKGETFRNLVACLDAVLIDIRMKPWSRAPLWRKKSLAALLPSGKYLHVPALGNVNYNKREHIQIADMDAGLDAVLDVATTFPVLLLCGCEDREFCHRDVVANALAKRLGVDAREIREIETWDYFIRAWIEERKRAKAEREAAGEPQEWER